jgi:hypothetical protein
MGVLSVAVLAPFSKPVRPLEPDRSPEQIRGNDNQLGKALNTHISDETIHTVTTTTTGVTTSAVAIYPAISSIAVGWIAGDNGSGKTFVDQVVWNGASNTKTVVSSTTIDGAPDARTYTVASGVLKLQMAAGTYTIDIIPMVF